MGSKIAYFRNVILIYNPFFSVLEERDYVSGQTEF